MKKKAITLSQNELTTLKAMPKYSIIIPVYNRPDEVDELLNSLTKQSYKNFEVIVIEDGSEISCEQVIAGYSEILDVKYFSKRNTGQGFSRNYGSDHAKGDWFIFYDSDCLIPSDYLSNLDELTRTTKASAFCGPDSAGGDFSNLQKAISYAMTSFLTTGGIRGRKVKVDSEVHLRSYNLVIQKQIFKKLNGFAKTNMGEDMELSNRFNKEGYLALISPTLEVYHKRRNSLSSFYKQVFSFGKTRIQLKREYDITIKLPHYFPALFVVGLILTGVGILVVPSYMEFFIGIYATYFSLILIHSSFLNKSLLVGILSVAASFIQHCGYGLGFMKEVLLPK